MRAAGCGLRCKFELMAPELPASRYCKRAFLACGGPGPLRPPSAASCFLHDASLAVVISGPFGAFLLYNLPPSSPFPFSPPRPQPCPHHIRHMPTSPTLARLRTCTLRIILHHNIPLLILQQPSLGSTSLPQALSHVPLAPPPARPQNSPEKVCSTGRHSRTGASGYVGSGYVCSVFRFAILLILSPLLGYYVIAIILSVITALITIYHHQIVAQLTPAAHTMKRSVIICISS